MSTEPQFLSFKGLKQYTPDQGWGQVNAVLQARTERPPSPTLASKSVQPHPEPVTPENVPTLTDEPEQDNAAQMFDPLINELFEQLRVPPTDELTQTWRTIAAEVNLLTQRMALQREMQERMHKLEMEMSDLRATIMQHLGDVQRAADQQLTSARLRAEVSALAQTKLSAKLNHPT